jgi:two-component system sensor histidine kinase KdpD
MTIPPRAIPGAPQSAARTGRRLSAVIPYLWSIAAIAAATAVAWAMRGLIADESLAMVFLSAVLVSCVIHGRNAGIVAAILAFLSYNVLFLEPRFTLSFAPVSDTLTLAVFLAVALLTGGLAGRVRDQASASAARASTMTVLFHASRVLATSADRTEIAAMLAEEVARTTRGTAHVLVRTGEGIAWAGSATSMRDESAERGIRAEREADADVIAFAEHVWTRIGSSEGGVPFAPFNERYSTYPLGTMRQPIGLLVCQRSGTERGLEIDDETIPILCELGAIAMERAYLVQEMTKAQVLAESDRLRTALLSSISHDFRTPLSGILASVTALLEQGEHFSAQTARELLGDIRDQAERTNRYVANLLDMIKLEAGAISVKLEPTDAIDIISAAARRCKAPDARGLTRGWLRSIPDKSCLVEADPVLLEQAIYNVLDNAMLYSPAGSSVEVSLHASLHIAEIVIVDEGPGIPSEDLERVFDKFYRVSTNHPAAQGTGLGLSISRGLVEAMGGTVRATSPVKNGCGTTIHICLKRVYET